MLAGSERPNDPHAEAQTRSALPELLHPFRFVIFDWDGTAVESRASDATRVTSLVDRLLGLGARVAIVTGTKLEHITHQLGEGIHAENARRLFVSTNRGSEVWGFDRRGRPLLLDLRQATPEEEKALDAVAEEVVARLTRMTGLPFGIVYHRLNRRKIDLIPEPAWADPPKSALGELLAATEARLRGGGLRHGLREAFELTIRVAKELGLPEARVTSDVKHIEIGLTDKSDAMKYLFTAIADPLGISAHDVLIVGDELGPIGGFEGSDSKMLEIPEVGGALVVSVGPEPGGAPAAVLHLGGGPARFCDMLAEQIAMDDRLGPFAPPRDASWIIEESGFDLAREHEIESLLAIANGYLGSRGSLAEGSSVSRPATFLAGAFEPSNDLARVPELVILPDWGRIRVRVEGEILSVERGIMLRHRRILDLRRGLLLREGVARVQTGHVTTLRTIHAASLAERHLFLEGIELTPQNYSGQVRLDAILSGEVKSASGASHWASFAPVGGEEGPILIGRTHGGVSVAMASRTRARSDGAIVGWRTETTPSSAAEICDLHMRLSRPCELYREVTVFSTRESADPRADAAALRHAAAARSFVDLVGDHASAWRARWDRAGIEIDGAPWLERALRFALYHLVAAANPEDARASIGARALTGEAYRGHVFWDTDIFMSPFYTYCHEAAARAQLVYRYRTIAGAKRKAARLGYEGALYAWESADTGDEATPSYLITPMGEVLRVLSGDLEHHISADVAYAVWAYVRATGDESILREGGLEILIETARFWASRVEQSADGVCHIRRVIGPDEYHEEIDDNAFTNWMARHNLRIAAAAAERFGGLVGEGEIAHFRDVAARLYLGLDSATGLIEQFDGFCDLEPVDLASFEPRTAPIDVLLGRASTQASQIVKQADVVELIALLWDDLSPAVRMNCFRYYEPRTAHGSSLSPGIHALVAARLGLLQTAARYLDQTARIDLDDTMGNAAGGVHAAALGSFWQATVFGVAGVSHARDDDDALVLEPHLLPGMRHLGVPLRWRGRELVIHVERDLVEVEIEGDRPLEARATGHDGSIALGSLLPGRRYLSKRSDPGYGPWEESKP